MRRENYARVISRAGSRLKLEPGLPNESQKFSPLSHFDSYSKIQHYLQVDAKERTSSRENMK